MVNGTIKESVVNALPRNRSWNRESPIPVGRFVTVQLSDETGRPDWLVTAQRTERALRANLARYLWDRFDDVRLCRVVPG